MIIKFKPLFFFLQFLFIKLTSNFKFIKLKTVLDDLKLLPDFLNSKSTDFQSYRITMLGLQKTLNKINDLQNVKLQPVNISKYKESLETIKIKRMFDINGSDKGSYHRYDLIYGNVLKELGKNLNILEIGIGTNFSNVPSNMGYLGVPGASLRSFRDFDETFQIVGCDIDRRILFNENRITSYYLDQLDDISWLSLKEKLKNLKFDLIIDDGLHSLFANLQTFTFCSDLIKMNGKIIIEDVSRSSLSGWQIIYSVVKNNWDLEVINTRNSIVLIFSKK